MSDEREKNTSGASDESDQDDVAAHKSTMAKTTGGASDESDQDDVEAHKYTSGKTTSGKTTSG